MKKKMALTLGLVAATVLALAAAHVVTAQHQHQNQAPGGHCTTCHGGSKAVDKAGQDVAEARKALAAGDSATAAKNLTEADKLLRELSSGLAATKAHRAMAGGAAGVTRSSSAVTAAPAAGGV